MANIRNFITRCFSVGSDGRYYNGQRDLLGFRSEPRNYFREVNEEDINLKAFSNYLKIDLTVEEIEVPTMYLYSVLRQLSLSNNVDYIYVPLYAEKISHNCVRSSNAALKTFFWDNDSSYNLIRKTVGNSVYYGGPGILFHEDMHPILMFTVSLVKNGNLFNITKPTLKVDANVFCNTDILSKYIKTKFIKEYIDFSYSSGYNTILLNNVGDILNSRCVHAESPKIIVEDLCKYMISPNVPDINFNSDTAYAWLENNIDDITEETL